MTTTRDVGLTQAGTYQIGVRRTLPLSLADAWELITSPEGLRVWLGDLGTRRLAQDKQDRTADGARVQVRVLRPQSHLRLTYQAADEAPSLIQVRTLDAKDKTIVAFHQEDLPDAAQRARRRAHFKAALAALETLAADAPTSA